MQAEFHERIKKLGEKMVVKVFDAYIEGEKKQPEQLTR